MIDLSNPGEKRDKVDPHCKSYAWVPVLWSFNKLREVGVFFYLVISCLKGHENGFGCCEIRNGHGFRFQEMEPMLDEGDVHGQPTYYSRTIKKFGLMVGVKFVQVFCMHVIA